MGTSNTSTGLELSFQISLDGHASTDIPGKCTIFTDNQAAIQAIAPLAINPNERTNPALQPEPESLRTLTATTNSAIHQTMRDEWERFWEKTKHGRELFKLGVRPGKERSPHIFVHRAISSVITQMRNRD